MIGMGTADSREKSAWDGMHQQIKGIVQRTPGRWGNSPDLFSTVPGRNGCPRTSPRRTAARSDILSCSPIGHNLGPDAESGPEPKLSAGKRDRERVSGGNGFEGDKSGTVLSQMRGTGPSRHE